MSAVKAFPLFTPRGEMDWVPEWNPMFFYPADGETEEGMVFTTTHDAETTYWNLVIRDPRRCYVKYARVTPTSRFGMVEVECRDLGQDAAVRTEGSTGCTVSVTYTFTALSEAGNAFLEQFTDEHFREMIDSWKTMIEAAPENTDC